MTCAECGATASSDGAKFCAECGAGLRPPPCAACGFDLSPGAKFCAECGAGLHTVTTVEPSGWHPVASRRVTSVLFGDLVGFTTLSEQRDQEEVRELLSEYFVRCRQVVERYGGTVEKFIGDAVMAVWGVPTAFEDDAERSVRAGLELVAIVTTLGGGEYRGRGSGGCPGRRTGLDPHAGRTRKSGLAGQVRVDPGLHSLQRPSDVW